MRVNIYKYYKLIFFVVFSFFLFSCATIFNKSKYPVKINTNYTTAKAEINDSIYNLPCFVDIKRSKENLQIKLITDTNSNLYTIETSLSNQYKYLNLFIWPGYFIDLTNDKRFTYGEEIFLDTNNYIIPNLKQAYKPKKGQIFCTLSLPWLNNFLIKPQYEDPRLNTGFIGFSTGISYYRNNKTFLSIDFTTITDFFMPFPAPIRKSDGYEQISSTYISISENRTLKKFNFGYGLAYSINKWNKYFEDTNQVEQIAYTINTKSQSFGLIFSSYYNFGRFFSIGIKYKPDLYRIYPVAKFEYEHSISIDLLWRFRIKK